MIVGNTGMFMMIMSIIQCPSAFVMCVPFSSERLAHSDAGSGAPWWCTRNRLRDHSKSSQKPAKRTKCVWEGGD